MNKKRRPRNLHEGKGVVYQLVSDSLENLKTALTMAKKNKKMKPMVPDLINAIKEVEKIK